MSLTLNTNVASLTAHRNMLSNDNQMSTSLERLSTGLRINKAADDASGMTIADSLRSQYLGIGQGIQNANEGVSIVQIADGALEESINIVNLIKTKAIQAASDGQTADTRAAIQADIDKLMEELDTIAKTTSYNGQQLLNGEFTNKQLQVGASSNQTVTIDIASTESTNTGHISTANLALDSEDGGEVQLTITSSISGEAVELESIEILQNNSAENGMGALADEINSQTYLTGISALAVVQSTTDAPIQEGATGSDFSINSVRIGAINVSADDEDSALVTAINDQTTETGVTASMEPNGALTLTSSDGRAITVTGDSGGVFADDLSTIGHITLTQSGSSQFNISGTSSGGTGDAITLNADLTTISESVLGAGSVIADGSTLAAGSVVGGDTQVDTTVTGTLGEYELTQGSSLATGSVLSQGTTVGGNVTVDAVTALNQSMDVTAGSVLANGSTLGAGTVVTATFTNNSITYSAGTTLTGDVLLNADLIVTEDMTLSDNSAIAAGSTLATGSVMGADITTTANATMTDAMTLGVGSTLAATSVMMAGSTLGDDTVVEAVGTGDITTYAETKMAAGSTLLATSVLAKDSIVEEAITVDEVADLDSAMTFEAGSTLTQDTLLKAGTTISQDMTLNTATGAAGTNIDVTAGSVLTQDLYVASATGEILSESMTLAAGSTIAAGSKLIIDSESAGDLNLTDQESLTLSDLDVMSQADAQIAIDIADAALADLDATRSSLGSVQNQLTSTITNLSVTKTNVQSAESTIRDVDFAEETANFTRLQLLGQTSAYAMSQANASSQNVLSLLQ